MSPHVITVSYFPRIKLQTRHFNIPRHPQQAPQQTRGHSPDAVSMLGQRRRRCAKIETALGECPVFVGTRHWTNVELVLAQRWSNIDPTLVHRLVIVMNVMCYFSAAAFSERYMGLDSEDDNRRGYDVSTDTPHIYCSHTWICGERL